MRNEAAFWDKVRGAINAHPHGVAHKLTDMFTAGTPDALYCIDGHAGVLELKYVPRWPVRSSTMIPVEVTENQRTWMIDWVDKGRGNAHVLLGVEQDWFLLGLYAPVRISQPELKSFRELHRAGKMKELKHLLPAMLTLAQAPVLVLS